MIYNPGWIHKPILIKPVRFEAVDFIFLEDGATENTFFMCFSVYEN